MRAPRSVAQQPLWSSILLKMTPAAVDQFPSSSQLPT
eukprot:CAMPEP_0197687840 /NCGR_PEP_ID=MMETSP1338-20131121/104559_1 /TAXON_ID=43686 ORGANISM="Pelagodinium beii, Strain RCC1491" /NCGR_SAMPLE_ID=MMETSP1338 /ASSEMBLY_ACC=CAM_ASM_000754 /LENGTH=36 /DNA_ID= /DNA_START= /DNA_END= /DNA_ORIENTATION=